MEKFHLKYQVGCKSCEKASILIQCKEGQLVPCILLKSIMANTKQFHKFCTACKDLSKNSILDAISTLYDAVDILEFVALYENDATFQKLFQILSSSFEDTGENLNEGKLWIRQKVDHKVLGISFIEWLSSKENFEKHCASPFRVHLLIITEFNASQLIKLSELIYTNDELEGFYIPVLYFNNSVMKTFGPVVTADKITHNDFLLLKYCLKLCIVLKNSYYYIGAYAIALISLRFHLSTSLLSNVRDCLTSCKDENYYFAQLLMRHFGDVSKIYDSVVFEAEFNNESSFVDNNETVLKRLFNHFVYPCAPYDDVCQLNVVERSQLCALCDGQFVDYTYRKYYWPILWSMLNEYKSIAEICLTIGTESPILAIETLRDAMGSIEFDVFYENELDRDLISGEIIKSLQNDGTNTIEGRLWTSYRVNTRKTYILNSSVLDWIKLNDQNEHIDISPFRLHLLVINHDKYTPIQLRNFIEFIYRKRGFREGIYIPLIYLKCQKVQTNMSHLLIIKTQNLKDQTSLDLMNSIYKFCIVLQNEVCHFGRYMFQMLIFQYKIFINILNNLVYSLKLIDSSNDVLKQAIAIVFDELLSFSRLENSKVFEMSFMDKSIHQEILDEGDIERSKLMIQSYTPQCSNDSNGTFIYYFLFRLFLERTSILYFFNVFKIFSIVFIYPLWFIIKCNAYLEENPNLYNKPLEAANSLLIEIIGHPNLTKIAVDLIIAVIDHYDINANSKEISFEDFKKIPAFNDLLSQVQEQIEAVVTLFYSTENVQTSQSPIAYESSAYVDWAHELFLNSNIPLIIKQILIELLNRESNIYDNTCKDQALYEIHSRNYPLIHLLANSFIKKSSPACTFL